MPKNRFVRHFFIFQKCLFIANFHLFEQGVNR